MLSPLDAILENSAIGVFDEKFEPSPKKRLGLGVSEVKVDDNIPHANTPNANKLGWVFDRATSQQW